MLTASILLVLMVECFKLPVLTKCSYFYYIDQNVNSGHPWELEFLLFYFCLFISSKAYIVNMYLFCYEKFKKEKGKHLFSRSLQSKEALLSSKPLFSLFCIIVIANLPFLKKEILLFWFTSSLGTGTILYSSWWYAQPFIPASSHHFWMQVPQGWMCTSRSLPSSPPICIKCLVLSQDSLGLPVD